MNDPNDATAAALQRYVTDGSDLTRPMTIDFFVAVPDRSSGELVAARVASLGFTVSVEQDEKTGAWTCYCTKRIVPAYRAVTEIERTLDGIARQYGGYADGFGSYGNAGERDETR